MLSDAFREDDDVGIKFHSRIDGGFYKPQRLKTHSKVLVDSLRDVLFADDLHSAQPHRVICNMR